jgi:hypothetical protein
MDRQPRSRTMGEYEPRDSRNVTHKQQRAPGEPPRTGPREGETRKGREDDAKARERAIEVDEDQLDAAERDGPAT